LIANAQAVENGTKTVVQAQNDIRAAANLAPTLINNLATAGARHILVFNLNDYADVPGAPSGVIVHAFIRAEVENFNRIGLQKLKETGRNSFIYIDTFGFFAELTSNGSAYGFTNTTDRACTVPVAPLADLAIYCTESTLQAGINASGYLWDGGLHPSATGHIALAQYVQSVLSAPGQFAYLADVSLTMGETIESTVNRRLAAADLSEPGLELFVEGTAAGQELESAGPYAGAKGYDAGSYAGAEVIILPGLLVGAMAGHSRGNFDYPGDTGEFDTRLYSGTVYGAAAFGPAFLRVSASGGMIEFPSVERSFAVYLGRVENEAATSGIYAATSVETGFTFADGPYRIMPTASLSYQRVDVDGYTETGPSWSTMTFQDQTREALTGALGAHVDTSLELGGYRLESWFGTAVHRDFKAGTREIIAGLTAAEGLNFAMPFDSELESWFTAETSLRTKLSPLTAMTMSSGLRTGASGLQNLWGSLSLSLALN
jgi:outer membrane lipase/esterase